MLKKIHLSYRLSYKTFLINEPLDIYLSDGSFLHIEKGFETDLSSVPRFLWGIFPPYGDFIIASIVHDYLYNVDKSRGRFFADKEMLLLSNKYNKNKLDNYIRFYSVRVFGGFFFNKKKLLVSK